MTEPIYGEEVYSQKLISNAKVRRFVSQNSRGYLSIGIFDGENNPADPDTLSIKIWLNKLDGTSVDPKGTLVTDTTNTVRDDVGKFHYDIDSNLTRDRGILTAEWTYTIGGEEFKFIDDMQILEQMPNYDRLRPDTRLLVEQASWFFADLFDSETGGPWLNENFQSHFTYDRIAFLLRQATMKFNLIGQPITQYGVGTDDKNIPNNFGDVIVWGTKLEAIRHLISSYTEIPDFPNTATTYTNRRDYNQRWREVLSDEKPEYEAAVKMAKRSLLRLGRGSLLVSGGIYGGGANGIFVPGMQTALTRSLRFYPAAPSVSWGAQAFGQPW